MLSFDSTAKGLDIPSVTRSTTATAGSQPRLSACTARSTHTTGFSKPPGTVPAAFLQLLRGREQDFSSCKYVAVFPVVPRRLPIRLPNRRTGKAKGDECEGIERDSQWVVLVDCGAFQGSRSSKDRYALSRGSMQSL